MCASHTLVYVTLLNALMKKKSGGHCRFLVNFNYSLHFSDASQLLDLAFCPNVCIFKYVFFCSHQFSKSSKFNLFDLVGCRHWILTLVMVPCSQTRAFAGFISFSCMQ